MDLSGRRAHFREGLTVNEQADFDKAYWLHQPPAVRDIQGVSGDERTAKAAQLAMQGYTVDVPIMVWGWDPYKVMKLRQDYGYAWVPSALMAPIAIAPGVSQPGVAPYDPQHPPAGAIRVSTNIADYPPFDPPKPPVDAPPHADPVGPQSFGSIYLSNVGDNYPDGAPFTDARGNFVKHIGQFPMGHTAWWELKPEVKA